MVRSVTGLTPHEIDWNLPLAQGLQYQALYLETKRVPTEATGTAGVQRERFSDIAGI